MKYTNKTNTPNINSSDELARIFQLEMEMLNDTPINYYSDDGGMKSHEC